MVLSTVIDLYYILYNSLILEVLWVEVRLRGNRYAYGLSLVRSSPQPTRPRSEAPTPAALSWQPACRCRRCRLPACRDPFSADIAV